MGLFPLCGGYRLRDDTSSHPQCGGWRVMRMTVSVFFLCCLFSPLVLRVPELAEIPQSTAQAKADEIARRLAEGQEERAIGRAQEDLRP